MILISNVSRATLNGRKVTLFDRADWDLQGRVWVMSRSLVSGWYKTERGILNKLSKSALEG